MGNKKTKDADSSKTDNQTDSKSSQPSQSSQKSQPTIISKIDKYATKYILTSNFQNLKDLQDESNCRKMKIITRDLLKKYLTPREIIYLKKRTENNKVANLLTREDFAFIDSTHLDKFDIKNITKKTRICTSIAEFYIMFFHLFASIVKVINPIFKYKDAEGNIKEVDLLDKLNIPANVKKYRKQMGYCDKIYSLLKPVQSKGVVNLHPKFCKQEKRSLHSISGIKELEELYKDKFNYDTKPPTGGKYYAMSDEMKEIYKKDVEDFYKGFTGENSVPSDVTGFANIETLDMTGINLCSGDGKNYGYYGNDNIPTFKKYGEHLNQMLSKTKKNQEVLAEILGEMFSEDEDGVIINPDLTLPSLKELVNRTRSIIVKIYLDCQNDFREGIQMFMAIVKERKINGEKSKIKLHKIMESKIMEQSLEDDPDVMEVIPKAPVEETPVEVAPEQSSEKKDLPQNM